MDQPTVARGLVDRLFRTAAIQRWTDHIRPLDLTVLGKHAHMMSIAWVLGHVQQDEGDEVDWDYLIGISFLELMRKSVLTDMKSQVLERFRQDADVRTQLDTYVMEQIEPDLANLGRDWVSVYKSHFMSGTHADDPAKHLSYRILRAASALATEWEFRLLENANPVVADLAQTRRNIDADIRKYQYLPGFMTIVRRENDLAAFVELIGRLRFQARWAQTPILPVRPVLDHELLVAYLAFLSADCLGASGLEEFADMPATGYHAFFGSLFHDMPEVLTRDIISPVKKAIPGLEGQLAKLEQEWFDATFKPMLPRHWFHELRFLSIQEFDDKHWPPPGLKVELMPGGLVCPAGFHPGRLIRTCDNLCAFIEAHESVMYGVESESLWRAIASIYASRADLSLCGMDFTSLFEDYALQLKGRSERSPWPEASQLAMALQ